MKILPKILPGLFVALILSLQGVAQAQPEKLAPGSRAELEIPELSIKLSQDGTGIIKNASCGTCDFNFVKITPKTQAYVNGVKVHISRVNSRAGKDIFIQFDTKTAEVLAIRWSE